MQDRLEKRWSPEQVSQALRREFPAVPERHVVHETIYQAVYRPELGGLSRELPVRVLRTRQAPAQAAPPAWRAQAERDRRDDDDRSAAGDGRRPP